ncbi:TolC family outer membrane protein [Sinimarinibacterium flocculans]|uniref:TolC family outer membrane protein n=1 Tax=Sinimarinibacterium flocculans TaxID=985250 RepID=UPI003516E1AF
MTRMPLFLTLSVLLAAVPAPAPAAALLDAWRAARQQDPELAAAQATRDAALQARPQARAALLPALSASAARDRERYRLDGGDPVINDPAEPQPDPDAARFSATRTSYGLDLRQPLFDLEAIQRLREAGVIAEQAQARYRDAEQQLVLRVAETYFALLAAADTLDANRAERTAYAQLVDQADKRLQTGLGARIGVEEAQAFYSFTEQSVIDAELALLDARRALMQLTGAALPVQPLRDEIPLESPQPEQAEAWLVQARADNPALQAARLAEQAAERGIDAIDARHWPTLALRGSIGRTDAPEVLGGEQRIDRIGVVAEWPLLQGGLVRAQSREAGARLRGAQAQREASLRALERDTLAAFRGVTAGIRTIRAARSAVDANRIALDASRNGVEAGTRTEFDLLNAQNNYYRALRAAYQSRYDYLRNTLRLKAQAGRLSETDLAAIDALLVSGRSIDLPAEMQP